MSCEVGPTGLSRLMTPIIGAGELPLAFGENLVRASAIGAATVQPAARG